MEPCVCVFVKWTALKSVPNPHVLDILGLISNQAPPVLIADKCHGELVKSGFG